MDLSQYNYAPAPPPLPPRRENGGWKKMLAPLAIVTAFMGKFKAALIPVLKFFPLLLKTGGSMFLMI